MGHRFVTAGVGIPLYVGLCIWGPAPFALGIAALSIAGVVELLRGARGAGIRANPIFALLGAGIPCTLAAQSLGFAASTGFAAPAAALLACGAIIGMVWEVVAVVRTGSMDAARNCGYGLLCGFYAALFAGIVWLRLAWSPPAHGGAVAGGAGLALLVTFCVWAADSAAFFAGRTFGHRKLAPALSPGKTQEGAIGGLAGAVIVGSALGPILAASAPLGALIGVTAGVLGPLGDLFESAIKRDLDIKDFGGILPGHGGVLDRFDSLIVVATAVAAALAAGVIPHQP